MTAFPEKQRDVTADGPAFRIDRNGDWYHGDGRIERAELAELFAGILRRDDEGNYWLWHPGERCAVTVADVPFIIEQVSFDDGVITLSPRYRAPVVLGQGAMLTMQGSVPYVDLGNGLQARCSTMVYYALVQHAVPVNGQMVIESAGQQFSLGDADAA